jgi:hypothetical protein
MFLGEWRFREIRLEDASFPGEKRSRVGQHNAGATKEIE